MKIMVSFITTEFSTLKKFWKNNKNNNSKSRFKGTDKAKKLNLGGKLAIIDWDTKEIIKEKNINTPAGFDIGNNEIYIADSGNGISILDFNLKTKKKIKNEYLNDLHSINIINNNYIILASTGLDCILILDKKGSLCWSWFATENGYDIDPKGRKRVIDKEKDHRKIQYPTLQQTTHLNSAFYLGKTKYFKNTIYCSLFHQGEILAIDKETSKIKRILKGLKHPHSIYYNNKKLIISDTENRSVILSNKDLTKIRRVRLKMVGWIQDATLLKNGNLLVSDSDNNQIIEFDIKKKKIIKRVVFNREWRIYQAKEFRE